MSDGQGTFLGRYRLGEVLGRGAMGVVYEAYDPKLKGRKVAIKTILKSQLLDPQMAAEYSSRFDTEAGNVASLNHPNIVTVYDFGNEADVAYLVMEFIDGKELKNYLDAKHLFGIDEAVGIVCHLLDALDYAHEKFIYHRDIKPANVMIDVRGRVKLTDFGVARQSDGTGNDGTRAGTMVGTPSYMSPEQIKGLPAQAAADLFATGVVLYQCLTLNKPFTGGSEWEIWQKIVNEDPPPLSQFRDGVPPALERALLRALAKDPKARPPTAAAMIADLKASIAGASFDPDATRIVSKATAAPARDESSMRPTGVTQTGSGTGSQRGAVVAPAFTQQNSEIELEFWRSIKDSGDREEFQLFLQRFPAGTYSDLARRKMSKLGGAALADDTDASMARQIEEQEAKVRQMRADQERRIAEAERERELARRKEEEAQRLREEAAARAKAEEEARLAEQARQAALEAERIAAAQREAARVKAEEEAARAKAAEEEAARIRAAKEEAARARAAEQEAKRVAAAEAEARRIEAAEEEAARVKAAKEAKEEAARVKAAKEEAARIKAAEEEAARVKAAKEEAARIKAAEEAAAREKALAEEAARAKAEAEAEAEAASRAKAEEDAARVAAAEAALASEPQETEAQRIERANERALLEASEEAARQLKRKKQADAERQAAEEREAAALRATTEQREAEDQQDATRLRKPDEERLAQEQWAAAEKRSAEKKAEAEAQRRREARITESAPSEDEATRVIRPSDRAGRGKVTADPDKERAAAAAAQSARELQARQAADAVEAAEAAKAAEAAEAAERERQSIASAIGQEVKEVGAARGMAAPPRAAAPGKAPLFLGIGAAVLVLAGGAVMLTSKKEAAPEAKGVPAQPERAVVVEPPAPTVPSGPAKIVTPPQPAPSAASAVASAAPPPAPDLRAEKEAAKRAEAQRLADVKAKEQKEQKELAARKAGEDAKLAEENKAKEAAAQKLRDEAAKAAAARDEAAKNDLAAKAKAKELADQKVKEEAAAQKHAKDLAEQKARDDEKAKAAQKPKVKADPDTLFAQAQRAEQEGRSREAVDLYKQAYGAGSGRAARMLGDIYGRGSGDVGRDYSEQLQWYERAKAAGVDVPTPGKRKY